MTLTQAIRAYGKAELTLAEAAKKAGVSTSKMYRAALAAGVKRSRADYRTGASHGRIKDARERCYMPVYAMPAGVTV